MRPIHLLLFIPLLMTSPASGAEPRLVCTLLATADLAPLLGADHDAPVDFGEDSCRIESKSPGRNVILSITKQPASQLPDWLDMIRKLNSEQRGSEVNVIAEPSMGSHAFSVHEKGSQPREVEFYAGKGEQALVLNATFATGAALSGKDIERLRKIVFTMYTKLP